MSFRHTYITEFLYKSGRPDELKTIEEALDKYGTVNWHCKGMEGLGYFHGIIKDSNGVDTKLEEEHIVKDLETKGVRIKIILE